MTRTMPWTNNAADASDVWAFLDPVDDAVDRGWEPLRRITPLTTAMVFAGQIGEHGLCWMAIAAAQSVRLAAAGRGGEATARGTRAMVALTAESIFVNGVLKSITRRSRPDAGRNRTPGVRMPISSSLPSGHATSAVMSAVILRDGATSTAERSAIAVTAAMVAASRVHVRIHHFTDVAAGVVLGYALGRLVLAVSPIDAQPERDSVTTTADLPVAD